MYIKICLKTSKIEVLNFGTRIISHSILLSRLYVHWGHFGLEDSTLIVVALFLPSSPSLSLASQTLSGVWLPSLGPFHEIEGGRSTAAAHAQNPKKRPGRTIIRAGTLLNFKGHRKQNLRGVFMRVQFRTL